MERDIQLLIRELELARHRIIGEIQSLEDSRHVDLLYRRYVSWQSWEQIADVMHYDKRHIHRLHGDALLAFRKTVMNESCH
ncbi:MAG: hypothetical protein HUJ76_13330 [Parasporobacterium sp.]|nr:hypothetical protein [Parasporobacterium sp.]